MSFIFGKGIDRLIIFYFANNGLLPNLKIFIDDLDQPDKVLFLSILMVSLQVFSDGNHRTALKYLSEQGFDVDRTIFYDFVNYFLRIFDFPSGILENEEIEKSYSKKWKDKWNEYNEYIIKKVGNNGPFILIRREETSGGSYNIRMHRHSSRKIQNKKKKSKT